VGRAPGGGGGTAEKGRRFSERSGINGEQSSWGNKKMGTRATVCGEGAEKEKTRGLEQHPQEGFFCSLRLWGEGELEGKDFGVFSGSVA